MISQQGGISRRHYLAASGATALVLGLSRYAAAQAGVTIRQGYQTNMWGMPTYYLMKSGLLEKRGMKSEEFAVPSGNLTMQQMVARQVDLGTYAGQSFIIGHDKGGLVGHRGDRDGRPHHARDGTQGSQHHQDRGPASGKKIANQTGSSLGNIFVDQLAPEAWAAEGLLPGGPHERERHDGRHVGQDRGRHGQHRALQHDRRGGRHRDHDHGLSPRSTICRYSWRRRPSSWRRIRQRSSPIFRHGATWRADFKKQPEKVTETIHAFFTSKGYNMSQETVAARRWARWTSRRASLRSRTLHAARRRSPAQREEDLRDPGLEEGAADRLHGEGPDRRLSAASRDMAGPAFAPAFAFGPPLTLRNALKVEPARQPAAMAE